MFFAIALYFLGDCWLSRKLFFFSVGYYTCFSLRGKPQLPATENPPNPGFASEGIFIVQHPGFEPWVGWLLRWKPYH